MRATHIRAGLMLLTCLLCAPAARAQGGGATAILGDTSGSMRGYADAKGGASRLSSLYQLIYRNAATPQLTALTSDARTKSARVAPVAQSSFFGSPKSYGGETDLTFALQQVQGHGGLTVFVTDGMQSGGTYLRVRDELVKMVSEGWGVWLLAVRLPFNGVYDPEQSLDLNTLAPTIEQCARQDDPNAVITFKKDSNRFFNYAGMKPLLIFVLTRDAAAGRDLTQRLNANLQADPQYSAQVAELAPLFYRGVGFAAAQPVSEYIHLDAPDGGVVTIRSDTVDGQREKEIVVPVVWRAGEPPIPQPFVERPTYAPFEEVSWVEDEPVVVPHESDSEGRRMPGQFRVRFISELPWYRGLCFLPLIACEEAKPDPLNLVIWTQFHETESPWWAALNADNSYQCPARVYKLSELAHSLAQAAKERVNPEGQKATKSLKLVVGRV